MNKLLTAAILLGGTMVSTGASAASLLGQEPDPSVIVNRGGLEWVWASPCAGEAPSCSSITLHHDFRFATESEWLASFADLADLIDAFLDPELCAATYFDNNIDFCNAVNLTGEGIYEVAIWHSPFDPVNFNATFAETFLVRGERVPEPAMLGLLGLGLVGLGAARRRRAA